MKPDNQNQEAEIKGKLERLKNRVLDLERERAKWTESERALRESEALLRQVAANYPNSYMFIIEKDLTIGFTSGQEYAKQNLNPDHFVGLRLEQVFEGQAPIVREHYLSTFQGEETSFELCINDQWQLYKTVPLPGEGGKTERILVVVENITERKLIEAARKHAEDKAKRVAQEWAATFDAISDGIFLMDGQNKILRCNRALMEMLGKSYEEILGLRCWEVVHDAQERVNACPLLQIKNAGSRAEEVLFLKERWFTVFIDPILDESGSLVGSVHVMSDITEKKQAEAVIQQSTKELGERVKELNCLYGISSLIEMPEITLDEILQGTVDLIPPAWQYPEIACARIIFGERVFVSENFEETRWQQARQIVVRGISVGRVEVSYLEERPGFDEGPFLKDERTLLNAITERLGRVVERIKAEEELAKLAATDPLTGLFNRRHFFKLAGNELERSRRYGHPLSCIMFDLDAFKEINDTYGHMFGDRVLQEVTRYCQVSLRQVDIFARFGGDEFIILLPETNSEEAEQVANRLRRGLGERVLRIESQKLSVTMSLGIASIVDETDAITLDTLVRRADQALYRSKGGGNNEVSVWRAN